MKITKEAKIGLTGILAIVVLFIGINFLKGVNLFSKQNIYYINFKNAKALSKNSTVYADGFNVGIVSGINYDFNKPGSVIVEISVDKHLLIPKGTTAKLDEGMLGGCTLNLILDTNKETPHQPGDTIQGSDANGIMSEAANLMPQVEQVMSKVDTLLASLNKLASDPNLAKTLQNTEALTNNLTESTQELNKLLKNDLPQLTQTFNHAGKNVVELTDNLNQIDLAATMDSVNNAIGSVNKMLAEMQNPQGSLGLLMKDPGLYNNLNHTIQSADSLLTDLKNHPKRYVHFSVFGKKEQKSPY